MISFSSSYQDIEQNRQALRRSDRKRTKKIFKEDIVDTATLRHRTAKKHKPIKSNENIPTYTNSNSIQLAPSLHLFQHPIVQNNIEALREMKQAVNRQKIQYEELLEIKLIAQFNRLKQNPKLYREHKYSASTENDFYAKKKSQHSSFDCTSEADCEGDLVRLATATDHMYLQFQCMHMDSNDSVSPSLSGFNMLEYPEQALGTETLSCKRKQSAIMLSDNYENNELMYNISQLQPQWEREQYIEVIDW